MHTCMQDVTYKPDISKVTKNPLKEPNNMPVTIHLNLPKLQRVHLCSQRTINAAQNPVLSIYVLTSGQLTVTHAEDHGN